MAGVMKDSEVEWIGEIPEGWDISKVKYVGRYINGYAFKPDQWGQDGLPIIRIQNLSGSSKSINYFDGKISDDYLIDDGDILISWSATLDAFIWNYGKGWLNQHIFKAIPNVQKIHKSYFFHLMKIAMLNMSSDKHGSAMQHVTNQIFGNFQVPLPSLSEQKLIADFLDEKCAEIDKLSEDIQKQIDILNDYKKSVITRAVTKGLDPNAEMKDSGVQWIGIMPSHWAISRGKFILKYLQKPTIETDGVITCFRDGEVTLRSNRREEGFTVADKEIGYQGIDIGDLVVHGMDGFAGAIGISDSRGKASPVLNVLDTAMDKKYIMYYLRSMAYSDVFLNLATGIRVRSCDLRWNKLANLEYPIPPVEEQKKISSYIENVLEATNETILAEKDLYEKLQDYKKSIIYEYVTGKKRVV